MVHSAGNYCNKDVSLSLLALARSGLLRIVTCIIMLGAFALALFQYVPVRRINKALHL